MTVEYLKERGALSSRDKFDQVLSKVPDEELDERDKF